MTPEIRAHKRPFLRTAGDPPKEPCTSSTLHLLLIANPLHFRPYSTVRYSTAQHSTSAAGRLPKCQASRRPSQWPVIQGYLLAAHVALLHVACKRYPRFNRPQPNSTSASWDFSSHSPRVHQHCTSTPFHSPLLLTFYSCLHHTTTVLSPSSLPPSLDPQSRQPSLLCTLPVLKILFHTLLTSLLPSSTFPAAPCRAAWCSN